MSNNPNTIQRAPTPYRHRLLGDLSDFERELNAPDYTFDYQPFLDPRYNAVDASHSYELPAFNRPVLPAPSQPGLPPFYPPPANGVMGPPRSPGPLRAIPNTLLGRSKPGPEPPARRALPRPPTPILPTPPVLSDSSDSETPAPRKASPRTRGRPRGRWSPREIEEAVRLVCEINPFGAKHGEKGSAWKDVAKKLRDEGLCKLKSVETVKNKVMALVAFQEVRVHVPVSIYLLTVFTGSRVARGVICGSRDDGYPRYQACCPAGPHLRDAEHSGSAK